MSETEIKSINGKTLKDASAREEVKKLSSTINIENKDIFSSFGVGFHSKDREEQFNDTLFNNIKDCGISRVRLFPNWARCETEAGVYNFDEFDVGVKQAQRCGLGITCVLGYNNPLYFDGDERGHAIETEAQQTAFLNYVKAVVTQYKGMGFRWEFYNEIGIAEFYSPSDGQESTIVNSYMTLIKSGYRTIKELDPGSEVIGGAIAQVTDKTMRIFSECCDQDLLNYIDGLVFHEYHNGTTIAEPVLKEHITRIRKILLKYGRGDMPIHLTEIGYNDCPKPASSDTSIGKNLSAEMKGAYILRALLVGVSMGLDEVLVYRATATREDETKQTYWYGIFSIPDNYAPTTSATMIKSFMDELKGYKFVSRLKSNLKDYYYLFEKDGSYKISYHTISTDHIAAFNGTKLELTGVPKITTVENINKGIDINTIQSMLDAIYSLASTNKLTRAKDGDGENSVVMGDLSTSSATGKGAVAIGGKCKAEGISSLAVGGGAHTTNWGESAFGRFNKTSDTQLFSVGNGTGEGHESNAMSVDKTGNIEASGNCKLPGGRFVSKGFNFSIKALFDSTVTASEKANLFVKITLIDSSPRLDVADSLNDVLGVALADSDLESGFVAEGFAYSKSEEAYASNVAILGTPFVLTDETDLELKDRVVPTTGGKAIKSDDGTGYLVIGVTTGKVRILLK
jgi:hypothetical protein